MSTWAIVPIKRLGEAKSSLSSVLKPEQRRELVLCMLADVLGVLSGTSVERIVVVSPDDEILGLAEAHGATCLKEPGIGLNGALRLAISHAVDGGADSVLIMPADVPMVGETDIEKMLEMCPEHQGIVIAPSSTDGTNALLLRPPDVMDVCFGGKSFPTHLEIARQAGVVAKVYRSQTIAIDIDEASDLVSVKARGWGTRTHQFLQSLSLI